MQNTMVVKTKPLIATDDSATKVKTTQGTTFIENESLILLDRDSEKGSKAQMIKKIFILALTGIVLLIALPIALPLAAFAIRKTNRYELL